MPKRKTALDLLSATLTRHARAVNKAHRAPGTEILEPDELAAQMQLTETMRKLEETRARMVIAALSGGGKLATMDPGQIEDLVGRIQELRDDDADDEPDDAAPGN